MLRTLVGYIIEKLSMAYDRVSDIFWLTFAYPNLKTDLQKSGYFSIRTYLRQNWHLGCRYLIAEKNNSIFFIKVARRTLISNEIEAQRKISEVAAHYISGMISYNLDGMNCYFVTNFLSGYIPLSDFCKLTSEQLDDLAESLSAYVDILKRVSIVHRDLSPDNIFVNKQDFSDLKVIDYAMSSGEGLSEVDFPFRKKLVLHSLGNQYRPKGNRWDDEFSRLKILSELNRHVD
jgi:serine/threonine protein kinase